MGLIRVLFAWHLFSSGLDALEGDGSMKIVARTAIASISEGVATALAGGKFADGAFSAAFFHLFNHEAGEMWEISDNTQKTFVFYDSQETGNGNVPIGATLKAAAFYYAGSEDQIMDLNAVEFDKVQSIMASNNIHRVMIIDHASIMSSKDGGGFGMQFGKGKLMANSSEWTSLVKAIPNRTKIVFASCLIGDASKESSNYLNGLVKSANVHNKQVAIYAYSKPVMPVMGGLHGLTTRPEYRPPSHWLNRQEGIQQRRP